MNILWFLLGIIACFGFELIFAVILAFKEMHTRKKHFEEMKKALDNIKIEITEEKPKKLHIDCDRVLCLVYHACFCDRSVLSLS